jgi:hypothetical protein
MLVSGEASSGSSGDCAISASVWPNSSSSFAASPSSSLTTGSTFALSTSGLLDSEGILAIAIARGRRRFSTTKNLALATLYLEVFASSSLVWGLKSLLVVIQPWNFVPQI